MVTSAASDLPDLLPYSPELLRGWRPGPDDPRHMRVTGSLAFVDISGVTRLTERLSRKGKVGAEEMSEVLDATFTALLTETRSEGGDLVKWGGDAVLLFFQGPGHAVRAARSAHRMRAVLASRGRLPTATGTLRMSVGIHSGDVDFFLVGDPEVHLELLVVGPAASRTAEMEAAAAAGQIVVSDTTCDLLPARALGATVPGGRLLRSLPPTDDLPVPAPVAAGGVLGPDAVLPVDVRRHLLRGAGEPEHRMLTVGFLQFSGTDDLLARAGPAALAQELDHVVRNTQHACGQHGVTFFETDIARDGGKIMLTAGAPYSTGHDEERMLRVSRMILDRAGAIPLRIGVNRGRVFAGDFGPRFRRTYSVKGDAINLAARLVARAAPGQALVTTVVLDRSDTLFASTPLPPFAVKGKARPVVAFDLGGLVGSRALPGAATPMAGRVEELGRLRTALDDVRRRRGRLVDIVAESGLGKSRLVQEALLDASDVTVLLAACEEYESSTPYFPFRMLLRRLLGMSTDTTPEQAAARLEQRIGFDAPHLVPWLPLVGRVLDIAVPSTPEVDELDDQFLPTRMLGVVGEFLRLALPTPTVLVVEDAHHMDEASAELLTALTAGLDRSPWLVLVTRQPATDGFRPLPGDRVEPVALAPLPLEDALELVRVALDDEPLTSHALEAIARRGAGHPVFLEALIAEARSHGGAEELPESVEGLVTAQIDRLDPVDRTVLRTAAVLGTAVDVAHVEMLLGEIDQDDLLRRLSDFLVLDRPGRMRFRNGLLRDVAYEGLPYRRRRFLHGQVGEALEQSRTSQADAATLSLHFFHAGYFDRAWRYSVVAGRWATTQHAHVDAIDLLARAVESAGRMGWDDAPEVVDVLTLLADSYFVANLPDEAEAAYARARRLARHAPVRRAMIIEQEARLDHRRRRPVQAMRRITRGLHDLDGVPGRRAEVARSLLSRRYAFSRFTQGRIEDALHWARVAARSAARSRDRDAQAQAYEMLHAIHVGAGRQEAAPYGRLALRAYVKLGNLPRQGHCINNLAVQAFSRYRWNDALADYRRAAEIFRRIGDSANESNATYNQAELLVRQGRQAEAEPLLAEVLHDARAVRDDELVALALREQARVLAAGGAPDAALAVLDQAHAQLAGLEEPDEVVRTDLARAEVLLDADRVGEAASVLAGLVGDDVAALADAAPTACRLIARCHLLGGLPISAVPLVEQGVALARADGNRYELGLLLGTLAEVNATLGRPYRDALRRSTGILLAMGVVDVQPTLIRASTVNRK